MKFSIVKVTSDDEEARYLVAIESPEFHKFYCSEGDRLMMITILSLERKPRPQKITRGCPCLGYRACEECSRNYQNKIDLIHDLREGKGK